MIHIIVDFANGNSFFLHKKLKKRAPSEKSRFFLKRYSRGNRRINIFLKYTKKVSYMFAY